MSIRRKGRRWEVRVSAGGGRRIEQRLPAGATRADAQALETALRRRLIDTATGRIDYTLVEAIDRWQIEAERLKSWDKDLRYRAAVLRDIVGNRRLSKLIDVADLVKSHGTHDGLKPASINRYLAVLKRIGTLAWRWGWTDHPIGARIELMPGEQRRTVYANMPQLRALLAAADPRLRDAMVFAALTGLRRSELLRATPIMLDGDALVLDANTKTGRPRVIPLPPEALEIAHRALPFSLSPTLLRKLWEQARASAGLKHVRWHDLRRTYGTWALRGGATLADVRDVLGHGDIKTTSIYLATARQDLQRIVTTLPTIGGIQNARKPAKHR
jgi:integrase